ncbi:MAG: hypothetical protein HeimC3_35130 [Candidatus Heimdallarchaeota archaeon LC_3]|nr:MAG: hypothetical protein HeimC3_35130 [Candidatus Heimdallarchaeota archaeon LC_3]
MDLVDQLTTVDIKGSNNIINFIEFYSQKPQSIIPSLLGINNWNTSTYSEVIIKTILKDNVIINYCAVPCDPFLLEDHKFYEILYNSAATVVLVPGLGSLLHNAFWYYVVGNEKINPLIPLFILAENPTNLTLEECKEDILDSLDLSTVWLREFEVYSLLGDKELSWDRFVTRLMKKAVDYLIVNQR